MSTEMNQETKTAVAQHQDAASVDNAALETSASSTATEKTSMQHETQTDQVVKRHKIREKLTEIYLKNDGLGKALNTALNELHKMAGFDLSPTGKLVTRDRFGRPLTDAQGKAINAESVVKQFLGEHDYLVATNWHSASVRKLDDFSQKLTEKGSSKTGRLALAQSIHGAEVAPDRYSERQESAESYLKRRQAMLLKITSQNAKPGNKNVNVDSRKGRLAMAQGFSS